MIGHRLGIQRFQLGANVNPTPPSNQPEVEAFIAAVPDTLDAAEITRLNTLVGALKAATGDDNLSDSFDVIRGLVKSTSGNSLINLAKRAHDATLIDVSTFTQSEGWLGDGANDAINSNYVPSTDAVALSLNSASFWIYNNIESPAYILDQNGIDRFGVVCGVASYNNNTEPLSPPTNTTKGWHVNNRTASNSASYYKDKASGTIKTNTPSALPSASLFTLARNNGSGSAQYHTFEQQSIVCFGRGFTAEEIGLIQDAFDAYLAPTLPDNTIDLSNRGFDSEEIDRRLIALSEIEPALEYEDIKLWGNEAHGTGSEVLAAIIVLENNHNILYESAP